MATLPGRSLQRSPCISSAFAIRSTRNTQPDGASLVPCASLTSAVISARLKDVLPLPTGVLTTWRRGTVGRSAIHDDLVDALGASCVRCVVSGCFGAGDVASGLQKSS